MSENDYLRQVQAAPADIDLGFWRQAEGVAVPDDELRFLLIPDAVESAAVADVARQVHAYQQRNVGSPTQITRALIVTMGGLLPGSLLHDHLARGLSADTPPIEFGTVGVSLYASPGVRYEKPRIMQTMSVAIADHTVLLVDDLGDYGGTLAFLRDHVMDRGATGVLSAVLYLKPAARQRRCVDFHFGDTDQETWIITPRERVETLVKRVPVWRDRGADIGECRRRLIELIGYPPYLVDDYLPLAFNA